MVKHSDLAPNLLRDLTVDAATIVRIVNVIIVNIDVTVVLTALIVIATIVSGVDAVTNVKGNQEMTIHVAVVMTVRQDV